jgi:predicted RNase H-like HicB family nuclease
MEIDYTVQIWREGRQFIAHAMPLDVASCGETPEAARLALNEAVRLFVSSAEEIGTLAEILDEAGYKRQNSGWQAPEWVCFEHQSALVSP